MAWFKCNETKRQDAYDDAVSAYTTLNDIVNYLFNLGMKEQNGWFKDAEYDDKGNLTSWWHSLDINNQNYQAAADAIHAEASNMKNNIVPLLKAYRDALGTIGSAITAFNNQNTSLASAYGVTIGEKFTTGDGSSQYVIEDVNGTEVIYYGYTDAEGTWQQITIPEMINSYYTEIGMNQAAIITTALADLKAGGDGILSGEEISAILAKTNSFVGDARDAGAFGVASTHDIEGVRADLAVMPEEVTGLQSKIDDLDIDDVMGTVTASCGVGAAVLGVYTLTDGFSTGIDGTTTTTPPTTPPTTPSTTPTTPPTTPPTTQPPSTTPPTTQPPTDTTGITTEPVTTAPVPTNPEDDDRLVQVDPDIEIPEVPTEPEIKPEDLDDLAREEYYNKYDPDSLADHQAEMLRQYENLYNEQDRDKLIEMFKEMGYNDAEAIAAANNRDIGQSAFLLGMQNKELTDIANSFAEEYGLTEGFDTSYDDTPDFADLYDGDAQASLTAPYESDAIMEAKENVTEAKDAYIESVATANSSITAATEAKENMNEVRASIEAKSGTDTSKWTEEDIAKYNEATENYNTAVTKANEDAAAAEAAKASYDAAKETLEQAEDDYYEKIKNGVQTQVGAQPGQETPQGNTPQQNVGGNVPNTGVTNTGNTTGNNEEENNTGNTSNDPFAEDMMNAFMGSK